MDWFTCEARLKTEDEGWDEEVLTGMSTEVQNSYRGVLLEVKQKI